MRIFNFVRSWLNTLTPAVFPPVDDGQSPRKRVLVLHCHPDSASYSRLLLDAVERSLSTANHEVRVRQLYGDPDPNRCYPGGVFDPVLSLADKTTYSQEDQWLPGLPLNPSQPPQIVQAVDDLRWCNAVVLVYPTWWFNLPAMLKGFFDRVFRPGVALSVQGGGVFMKPLLTHIQHLGVVTTYGSGTMVGWFVGDGGKAFIHRCVRSVCAPRCQLLYYPIHDVGAKGDWETEGAKHLRRVELLFSKF